MLGGGSQSCRFLALSSTAKKPTCVHTQLGGAPTPPQTPPKRLRRSRFAAGYVRPLQPKLGGVQDVVLTCLGGLREVFGRCSGAVQKVFGSCSAAARHARQLSSGNATDISKHVEIFTTRRKGILIMNAASGAQSWCSKLMKLLNLVPGKHTEGYLKETTCVLNIYGHC